MSGEPGAQPAAGSSPRARRYPSAQLLPELPQPQRALMRQVAGDNRGIDRADRGAGDPVRTDPAVLERGVGPGLICAERATARQDQGDAVKTGQTPVGSRARHKLLPRSAASPKQRHAAALVSPVLVTTFGQESGPGWNAIIRGRDLASSLQTPFRSFLFGR